MKRKQLTCAALAGLLVPALLSAPTVLATEQAAQSASELAEKTEDAAKTQPSLSTPAKETPTVPSQQPAVPGTTTGSSKAPSTTVETKPATESSSVKPVEKPKTETTTSSEGGKETPSTTTSTEKAEVKPLDVEVFPPNEPTNTHPAINVLPTQSIRKGDSFDPDRKSVV